LPLRPQSKASYKITSAQFNNRVHMTAELTNKSETLRGRKKQAMQRQHDEIRNRI
jgi:5-methylcytosine-specific restriction endonuclease McrA